MPEQPANVDGNDPAGAGVFGMPAGAGSEPRSGKKAVAVDTASLKDKRSWPLLRAVESSYRLVCPPAVNWQMGRRLADAGLKHEIAVLRPGPVSPTVRRARDLGPAGRGGKKADIHDLSVVQLAFERPDVVAVLSCDNDFHRPGFGKAIYEQTGRICLFFHTWDWEPETLVRILDKLTRKPEPNMAAVQGIAVEA